MHLLSCFLPFASVDFEPWMIGAIVPVAVFVFAGAIAISAMYFKHQKQLAWHQTARIALEKGQPVPPMPAADVTEREMPPPRVENLAEWEKARRAQQRRNDIRAGLILVAVGAGLFLMMRGIGGGDNLQYVGAIPGFIGVAMLLHGLLDAVFAGKS